MFGFELSEVHRLKMDLKQDIIAFAIQRSPILRQLDGFPA